MKYLITLALLVTACSSPTTAPEPDQFPAGRDLEFDYVYCTDEATLDQLEFGIETAGNQVYPIYQTPEQVLENYVEGGRCIKGEDK